MVFHYFYFSLIFCHASLLLVELGSLFIKIIEIVRISGSSLTSGRFTFVFGLQAA